MPRSRLLVFAALAILALIPAATAPVVADGGANHQARNMHFGVSGGNVNDSSRAFCCSGTLGSLLQDAGGNLYILSNNHVLNRSGLAAAGDDISQPGLIDNGCSVAAVVADLTVAAPLGSSNVDAAIAELRPGMMDATGFIEDIGVPAATTAAPAVGLGVAKSGRTTGLTTGAVSGIDATIRIQYQRGCGSGRKFRVTFTNQVVIGPGSFSAGGDSGSLIVTNDAAHQPVALLYAGSSTTTIGNPIAEVLSALSAAHGSQLSFPGSSAGPEAPAEAATPAGGRRPFVAGTSPAAQLPEQAVEHARAVLDRVRDDLMSRGGVIGVAVGASEGPDADAVIVVYVDRTEGIRPQLPARVSDVGVRVVYTDPFIAY